MVQHFFNRIVTKITFTADEIGRLVFSLLLFHHVSKVYPKHLLEEILMGFAQTVSSSRSLGKSSPPTLLRLHQNRTLQTHLFWISSHWPVIQFLHPSPIPSFWTLPSLQELTAQRGLLFHGCTSCFLFYELIHWLITTEKRLNFASFVSNLDGRLKSWRFYSNRPSYMLELDLIDALGYTLINSVHKVKKRN